MSAVATETPAASRARPLVGVLAWDWWLAVSAAVLAGFGLLAILSASSASADTAYSNAFHFVGRQALALGLGITAGAAVVFAPWRWVRASAIPAWFAAGVGLLAVLTPLGHSVYGASRWIRLGPINVQPSEFAKIALILALSHYLASNEGRLRDFLGVVIPSFVWPLPLMTLVMLEPDFGTTVILCGLSGVLLFVAGLQWRYVLTLGGIAVAALGALAVVAPYRVARLVSFLDPFSDPDGAGYQIVQGWIALAAGGLFGRGLGSGGAQQGFLPEAHTDFVSAVVGEELGAVGFLAIVLLQGMLVWRGTVIASRAPDLFSLLVAVGVTAVLGGQAVINLGVVVGLLPAKGLVLPFLSYGASAAVAHALCVALLLRISLYAREEGGPPVQGS